MEVIPTEYDAVSNFYENHVLLRKEDKSYLCKIEAQ